MSRRSLEPGKAAPQYRDIKLGKRTFRARVVPENTFGLGTQLDQFYAERNTEPHLYQDNILGMDRRMVSEGPIHTTDGKAVVPVRV